MPRPETGKDQQPGSSVQHRCPATSPAHHNRPPAHVHAGRPQIASPAGGSGVVIGSHSAQLARTAAAVTDRWAPKNFHIAVDARGPRASTNDPLEEPPDQA